MQLDSIKSLEDIENKLITNNKGTVHHDYNFMVGSDKITIYGISIDDKGLPKVKYAIVISMDMNFKIWHKEKVVPFTRLERIPKRKELSYFNEILQIIDFLQ